MKETRLKYYSPAAAGHQQIIRELWKLIFSLPAIESFQLLQKSKEFIWISKINSTQNILSLFYPDLQRGIGIVCCFSCQSCFSVTGWPQMIKCQTMLLVWEQTKMQSFNICPQSGDKVRQEPDHKNHLLLTCKPTHFTAGSVFSKVCSNISRVFWSRIFKCLKLLSDKQFLLSIL